MVMATKKIRRHSLYNLPIVIEPCEEGGYVAICPSLPGCHVEADTVPQVMEYLEDAIKTYIQSLKAHGDSIPKELEAMEADQSARNIPMSFVWPFQVT